MKKMIVAAALAVVALTASAQRSEKGTLTLTPQVGVALGTFEAHVKGYDQTGTTQVAEAKSKVRPSVTVGAELGYMVTSWFKPSIGLNYVNAGTKADVWNLDAYALEENGTAKISTHLLNIPILAQFYVWKGLALKIGVQPGFVLGASDELKDYMKTFTLSIPVGVSYEYKNVVLDVRYNPGVTKAFDKATGDVDHIMPTYYNECKNQWASITQGYKFEL